MKDELASERDVWMDKLGRDVWMDKLWRDEELQGLTLKDKPSAVE